jgi:hypothetical protein
MKTDQADAMLFAYKNKETDNLSACYIEIWEKLKFYQDKYQQLEQQHKDLISEYFYWDWDIGTDDFVMRIKNEKEKEL